MLRACRALAARTGAELRVVRPTRRSDRPRRHGRACRDDVGLVSVMAVNNEVGTVQPLARRGRRGPAVAGGGAAHRRRPGRALAGRRRGHGGGRSRHGQRPQIRWTEGHGVLVVRDGTRVRPASTGAARSGVDAAGRRTWPGRWARPPRWPPPSPGVPATWRGWPRCATGWPTDWRPRCPERRDRRPGPRVAGILHLRMPASSPRPRWCCSTRPASPFGRRGLLERRGGAESRARGHGPRAGRGRVGGAVLPRCHDHRRGRGLCAGRVPAVVDRLRD